MKPEKVEEYKKRLRIDADEGNDKTIIHTESNMVIAWGYERVVIGDRGPYIELANRHILLDGIFIPREQHWRIEPKWRKKVYYFEFRTIDESYLRIYLQNRRVNFADYQEEFWYVDPFKTKVRIDDKLVRVIEPKKSN